MKASGSEGRWVWGRALLVGLCLCCMLGGLAGCLTQRKLARLSDEQLFQRGSDSLSEGKYYTSRRYMKELTTKYPNSERAPDAQLLIADSYFEQNRFKSATPEYENFVTYHPVHPSTPHARWRLAMCKYNLYPGPDLDQALVAESLRAFQDYIAVYPNDAAIEDAKYYLEQCQERVAAHHFYVGFFYAKWGDYQAAINRFNRALESYRHPEFEDQILYYLAVCNEGLGKPEEAARYFLQVTEQFPDSKLAKQAKKQLARTLHQRSS